MCVCGEGGEGRGAEGVLSKGKWEEGCGVAYVSTWDRTGRPQVVDLSPLGGACIWEGEHLGGGVAQG